MWEAIYRLYFLLTACVSSYRKYLGFLQIIYQEVLIYYLYTFQDLVWLQFTYGKTMWNLLNIQSHVL